MALKGNLLAGLVIGIGAYALVPILAPALSRFGRPAAKALIRAGLLGYGRGRETLAELSETAEDLIAEVRAELELVEAVEGAVTGEAASPTADPASLH